MAFRPFVVFLAFANTEGDLPELREETRQLQELFEGFAREGRCELIFRPNATLDQIYQVLTSYRDRIAIFHYGGHADSGRLLLESALGAATANAQGLASLLGQQAGMKFVFLNGCSTRPQVKYLLESNVPAVIATARPIDDTIARKLSVAFYQALTKGGDEIAGGRNIRGAFESAKGFIAAGHGGRTREFVVENPAPEDVTDNLGLPWDLFIRPGAQQVERWSLFTSDPLFGLPELPPELHPPVRPFRGLQPFSRAEAAVFFGRGRAVRELFDLLTTPGAAPVIFYYGETGVGKSSVLDAGLVPRLETRHQVIYVRRKPELGLLGTLRSVLVPRGSSAPFDLDQVWLDREASVPDHRPLVIILDQCEEAYTRPYNPDLAYHAKGEAQTRDKVGPEAELCEFFEALRGVFGDASRRPQGKLILGFRKEWLQEFVHAAEATTLWVARMPLEPLGRDGIIEAIEGPASKDELKSIYRLSVEEGLAAIIADDLRTDTGSALAPTLQILLSKMWDQSQRQNVTVPSFDQSLYEGLKKRGLLLDDFLAQQLASLRAWRADVVDSGLALDLLEYHTTPLGTAEQRTRSELLARYPHRSELLESLVDQCKSLYLLIRSQAGTEPANRLAHDTLAPLVQDRFRASVAPGQRARRVLENRASEWQGEQPGAALDTQDLKVVEAGASGMRAWTAPETRLVEASRRDEELRKAAENKRKRLLRALRVSVAGLAVLASLAAVVATIEKGQAVEATKTARTEAENARNARDLAQTAEREAELERNEAERQKNEAEYQAKLARASSLAAQADLRVNRQLDLAFLLSAEAIRIQDTPQARGSLLRGLVRSPGLASILGSEPGTLFAVAFSPDGKTLAAVGEIAGTGGLIFWDLTKPQAQGEIRPAGRRVRGIAFSPDGKTLVTGGTNSQGGGTLLRWDVASRQRIGRVIPANDGGVSSVAFSPDGKTLVSGGGHHGRSGNLLIWDVTNWHHGGPRTANEGSVTCLAFSQDGTVLATGGGVRLRGGNLLFWDVGTWQPRGSSQEANDGGVTCLAISPDGKILVTGGTDREGAGNLILWDTENRAPRGEHLQATNGPILSAAFGADGKSLLAWGWNVEGRFGSLLCWGDYQLPRFHQSIIANEGVVRGLAFNREGQTLATAGRNGDGYSSVYLWNAAELVAGEALRQPLPVRDEVVQCAVYTPDLKSLITGGRNDQGRGRLTAWDLATRQPGRPVDLEEGEISKMALSPDGKVLATAIGRTRGGRGSLILWDLPSRLRGPKLEANEGGISSLAFSPDGKILAAGGGDQNKGGTIIVWNCKEQKPLQNPLRAHERGVSGLAFSPDGETLASVGRNGAGTGDLILWDATAWKKRGESHVANEGGVSAVSFSPKGDLLATGGMSAESHGTVIFWNAKAVTSEPPLDASESNVSSLAFSLDGSLLVTGGENRRGIGDVILWDVGRRQSLSPPLAVGNRPVTCLAFRPDGNQFSIVVSAPRWSSLSLYEVSLSDWQNRARKIANRNLTQKEWDQYLGPKVPYHKTFGDLPDGQGVTRAH